MDNSRLAQSVLEYFDLPLDQGGKLAGWIGMYGSKKIEIKKGTDAKDLYGAKQFAIKALKVPKSKVGLLSVVPAHEAFEAEALSAEVVEDLGLADVGDDDDSADESFDALIEERPTINMLQWIAKKSGKDAKAITRDLTVALGNPPSRDPLVWDVLTATSEDDLKKAWKSLKSMRGQALVQHIKDAVVNVATHKVVKPTAEAVDADIEEQQKGTFIGWTATLGKKTVDVSRDHAKSMLKALEYAMKQLGVSREDAMTKMSIEPVYESVETDVDTDLDK